MGTFTNKLSEADDLHSRGLAERTRQLTEEGYTREKDVGRSEQLLAAAACYSGAASYIQEGGRLDALRNPPADWPWSAHYWKPSPNAKRMREKAYALTLAAQEAMEAEDQK